MKFIKAVGDKIDFFVFYASVFTLSQSIKLSSKLLFLALVFGVVKTIYKKDFKYLYKHKLLLIIFGIFFSYICIQGIYLEGFNGFFNAFEKHYAPYLIFLLIPFLYREQEQVKLLPKVFIAGLLFTLFLIVCMSIIQLEFFDRRKVLEVFDLHHLYISLYILFAINYLAIRLSSDKLKKTNVLIFLMLIVLVGFLVFFRSKAALVIFFVLLGFHTLRRFKSSVFKNMLIIAGITILIIIFNNFFFELYLKALDFRLNIWDEGITVISQNVFFGFGAPNEYLQLNVAHFLEGNYDFLDSNYNAHNQYLSFLIRFGLIGLLLIVMAYIIPYFKISKITKKEYIGFLLIVGGMAFVESLFNRHHGIVFCTIMLYYYNTMSKNELKI
jgi:O-antigen ligase